MSEGEIDEVLRRAGRCLLVTRGSQGPDLVPTAFWFDGEALWFLVVADSTQRSALRAEPDCGAYVPPFEPAGAAALVHGRARAYAVDDPVALVLHGPVISTALAALAVKQTSAALGARRQRPGLPTPADLAGRVVLRLPIGDAALVDLPEVGPGLAPALPTVVPADVRRALAGRRSVVVAVQGDALRFGPGVWSPDYALGTVPDSLARTRAPAAICVDADETERLAGPVSLTLHGRLDDGRLVPTRAVWWRGRARKSAEIPTEAPGSIELPD